MVFSSESFDEIARRGRAVYDRQLRAQLEPRHNGEYLILNVDTGEFEIDADDAAASKRAQARFPRASLVTIRVGHHAAYRIGARSVTGS
ncbi:MAG: hypothetical protein HOP29_00905 [Phycisphaerales bacterium]|nr:hypothetical protein [Phycisphaerales bacterium]